jgi:hypothetical protein
MSLFQLFNLFILVGQSRLILTNRSLVDTSCFEILLQFLNLQLFLLNKSSQFLKLGLIHNSLEPFLILIVLFLQFQDHILQFHVLIVQLVILDLIILYFLQVLPVLHIFRPVFLQLIGHLPVLILQLIIMILQLLVLLRWHSSASTARLHMTHFFLQRFETT